MGNIHRFLTYSEITDNSTHKGTSIDIEGLTLDDIKEAIEKARNTKNNLK